MSTHLMLNDLPEKRIIPVLSPELRRLLECETGDAVYEIVHSPELAAEVASALPVIRAAARQKAGEAGVRDVIGRRMVLYPQSDRSDSEWAAWWSDYYEALADLSWAALEAGMAAWVRDPTSEFMPKPGKLRELATTARTKAHVALSIAERVAQAQRPKIQVIPAAPDREPPSDAEKIAVRSMLADFNAKMGARSEAERFSKPAPAATHGKTDEGGLTPQMRALIAKREGDSA